MIKMVAPPNQINFCSQFFQKLYKNNKRLEVIDGVLYRQYFDHSGKRIRRQIVVPETLIMDIIRTLHENPVQGHPGSKKMLQELRKRYYSPNLAEQVQTFISNCQACIQSKPIAKEKLRPPLQKIYDPCN